MPDLMTIFLVSSFIIEQKPSLNLTSNAYLFESAVYDDEYYHLLTRIAYLPVFQSLC